MIKDILQFSLNRSFSIVNITILLLCLSEKNYKGASQRLFIKRQQIK
jgi:hypothetical protein